MTETPTKLAMSLYRDGTVAVVGLFPAENGWPFDQWLPFHPKREWLAEHRELWDSAHPLRDAIVA